MVVNPILYSNASSNIDIDIASGGSQVNIYREKIGPPIKYSSQSFQYTTMERSINTTLKWKFFMINFIFYICWIPNLICGVILWTSWHKLPENFLIPIWYLMAILNPLQAFLNALVYRKWQPTSTPPTSGGSTYLHQSVFSRALRLNDPTGERAPLLQQNYSGEEHKASAPPFHTI